MSWEGKCCLVTGGTTGIGRATVEALAVQKARVFTCAIPEEDVDAELEEWHDKGYDVDGCVCDVSKKKDLKTMVAQMSTCFGGELHALVNNAAIAFPHTINGISDEDYEKIMSTNLRPAFDLCRMCYPLLKSSAPSSVVLLGSIAASRAVSGSPVYALSKASLKQLAMNLACEWAPDQIRVNCVSPGVTDTPMTAILKKEKALHDATIAEIPMKRVADPNEIARAVLFFSGSDASYITGQNLYVDGGFSVRGLGLSPH